MKKIYGFLGAAALLALGACSNETLDGPQGPQTPGQTGNKGDLFMTMNVSMASAVGTRTSTPNQGYEVGQDYENKISSALIILANGDDENGYTVAFSSGMISSTGIVGDASQSGAGQGHEENPEGIEPDPSHSNSYKASFTFDRASLQAALTDDASGTSMPSGAKKMKKFTIFVVANPTQTIITGASRAGADLQQLLAEADNTYDSENNTGYWKKNNFLMSSAAPATKTIYDVEIDEGECTTKESAYKLGTVKVQRAMSRFDLDVDNKNITFDGTGGDNSTKSDLPTSNIKVEFDAVSMINMAKTAYLFKVMAAEGETFDNVKGTNGYPIMFGDERESDFEDYWTWTPDQANSYHNQLFTGQVGSGSAFTEGEYNDLADFFPASGGDWQTIASIKTADEDNSYEHTGHSRPDNLGAYRIWRYAMENTNPDNVDYQVNGTSTGIIFRAKLSDTKAEEEGYKKVIPTSYDEENDQDHEGEIIYAYNNVILGTAEQLFAYATNAEAADDQTGIYPDVNAIIWSIIGELYDANRSDSENLEKGGWTSVGDNDWWIEEVTTPTPGVEGEGTKSKVYHHPDLKNIFTADALVKLGFSLYEPTEVDGAPVYYCYYIYWNRHNDNERPTQMGIMEFATVRNNVYKLSVSAVKRLGHPGDPDNDPYSPEPDTPDEEDEFWLTVECKILPWEVRINNIEF